MELDGKGELPLHLAARQGHDKTLDALLQHYKEIGHREVINTFPKVRIFTTLACCVKDANLFAARHNVLMK